jgi:hypothetical protein
MKEHAENLIADKLSGIDRLVANHMTHEQHELLWVRGLSDVIDIIQDTVFAIGVNVVMG